MVEDVMVKDRPETETEDLAQAPVPTRSPKRSAPRRWPIVVARLGVLVVALGMWELAAVQGWINVRMFGQPSGIWSALIDYVPSERGTESLRSTGEAIAIAFVVGSILGTLGGLVLGIMPTLNAILGAFLTPLNSVPRIALAPLFITWFGLGTSAKVVLAVSIVFFILAENGRSAVKSVDHDIMTMARVTGLSRTAVVAKVVLPSAVPQMFAGLRLAFTYSLLGVIASEMIAAPNGLGQDIVFFSSSYQLNAMFAILVLLMTVAMVVNLAFGAIERYLLRWQQTS